MANLKEIRIRIASVQSTQQITSAMKMVSASKLRKSQNLILKLRPYSAKMTEIVQRLGSSEAENIPFVRQEKKSKVMLLVLTSNKGLCSTFNSSVIKSTLSVISKYENDDSVENVSLWTFGKKGSDFLKKICSKQKVKSFESIDEIWDRLDFKAVESVADRLMNAFIAKTYDRIEIIYNQFKNSATTFLTHETFLPLSISPKNDDNKGIKDNYLFEPSKETIFRNVIPQALKTQLYKCFLDSFTSEHGTRMTSMHKATDNAQNLLKDLKLTYNKIRQSAITNEIIEICSGSNALNE
ncbi:MAG: ATP synthase F1 subunit gamma [Bacteroidales bacterium]|jgi:F-type H+-transporting ATPase subunit gamma|nr:ATP synthase F1 subunit gamma [Bacteroidales bacterium]